MKTARKGCLVLALPLLLFIATPSFADTATIESFLSKLPKDVQNIYNALGGDSYADEINKLLADNKVTTDDLSDIIDAINDAYENILDSLPSSTPLTTVQNGLADFCDELAYAIPNAQPQQNVWASAWIGDVFHFGFGVNVGVADLDISSLKEAALALGIDEIADIQDNLYFPTITADFRIGGVFLPFDVGFTFFSLDTSDLGSSVADAIDPITFDLYAIGVDLRYALLKGGAYFRPRMSLTAGFYYTDGGVYVSNDDAKASLEFNSATISIGTQASVKFLCFVPFAGFRGLFTKTTVDWEVQADWASILGDADGLLQEAVTYGILPKTFGGSNSSEFKFHPQIYGGLGLDLLALDITFSGSYDFISDIGSMALSIRIAF